MRGFPPVPSRGVPVITPAEVIVVPPGSPVAEKVYGGLPPEAEAAELQGAPTAHARPLAERVSRWTTVVVPLAELFPETGSFVEVLTVKVLVTEGMLPVPRSIGSVTVADAPGASVPRLQS
jgi:hypothetical protein